MQVGLTFESCHETGCDTACRETVAGVVAAIERLGYDVVRIGSGLQLVDKLAAGQRFDMVLCCGNDAPASSLACVPALLDAYQLPYAFSSPATLLLCQQPAMMKSLLRDRGVPTSDYWLVDTLGEIPRVDAAYPLIVRSACGSDSPRLIVNDANQLSKACCQVMGQYSAPAIVEAKLPGETLEVGMLGSGAAAEVLLPSHLPATLTSSIERTARAAWRIVGGLDAGLIAMQCDADDQPHVTSINPVPSLSSDSSFMQRANASGRSLDAVIQCVLSSAMNRASVTTHQMPLRHHMKSRVNSAELA